MRERSNYKKLTSIGLEPVEHCTHCKNFIGNQALILDTVYDFLNNDSSNAGKLVLIVCTYVGKIVKATKDWKNTAQI